MSIEEGDLRFKSKFLTVSEIANQYYCEKQVEMRRIHGEEETIEMQLGKEAHNLLYLMGFDTTRLRYLIIISEPPPLILFPNLPTKLQG